MTQIFKAQNVKAIYIDENCLGKTKMWESAKKALLVLGESSNIHIMTSSPERLNVILKEAFGKTEKRMLPKIEEIEMENGKTKKKRTMVEQEVEVLAINPRVIEIASDNNRVAIYRSAQNTSIYDVWIVESDENILSKFMRHGLENYIQNTFQVRTGCEGQFFIVKKHSDWSEIVKNNGDDVKEIKTVDPSKQKPEPESY